MFSFFFFNDTATTEIYTLSLHDALPISLLDELPEVEEKANPRSLVHATGRIAFKSVSFTYGQHRPALEQVSFERSEEHTSELQSPCNLVCRLLLEKKKNHITEGPGVPPY